MTLCVRTCDGYYFPVSYSALPSKFGEDAQTCQRMCPATEATLYSHRTTGEDITQAVSANGRLYTELPNAFAYRKQFNPSCSCKAAGQTWADALKQIDDQTIERGDVVVTEERAKQLAQPQVDAQGKPIKPAPAGRPGTAPSRRSPSRPPPPMRPSRRYERGRRYQQAPCPRGRSDLLAGALGLPRRPAASDFQSVLRCHSRT